MTADERALIQAVIAAPDDDTPRMVYADWLDEHGRPERAEFIRVDCELARLADNEPGRQARAEALWERRVELIEAHYRTWEAETKAGLPPNRQTSVVFRRGMPAEVICTVKYFAESADAILRIGPIELVHFQRPSPRGLAELAKVPGFARVPGVWLSADGLSRESAAAFLALPLGHLRYLAVAGLIGYACPPPRGWNERSAAVAELVAGSASLSGLHHLDLQNAGIGDAGGRALARSGPLSALRQLDLHGNRLADATKGVLRDRFGNRIVLSDYDHRGHLLDDSE